MKYAAGDPSIATSTYRSSATCSAHAYGKSSRLKKTPETQYLTVEMVRSAASAVVEGFALPASARRIIYEQKAYTIAYYLRRNQAARKSHTKTKLRRLHDMGIDVETLPSCDPDDSS